MFLRISSALLPALLLAGCSFGSDEQASSQSRDSVGGILGIGEVDETVECALNDAETFASECKVDRISQGGKRYIVVRHPDGGFRRLEELPGGKGFRAADGADQAETEANGQQIEVTVGADHYLFPAPARTTGNAAKR